MEVYEDIARLANEIGHSPDFVLVVCFWLSILCGFGLGLLVSHRWR